MVMARRKPSFFKVLVGDFSNQLQIPPPFLVHFDGNVPQLSRLRTSARTWAVNVKKVNDKFFFQKGWKKFVHDHDLKLCEFLEVGDVCASVLINKVKFLFEAAFYRKAEASSCTLSPGQSKSRQRINSSQVIQTEASFIGEALMICFFSERRQSTPPNLKKYKHN